MLLVCIDLRPRAIRLFPCCWPTDVACGSRSRRNILINHAKVKQFPTPFGRKLPFSIDLSQRRINGSWTASHFMQRFANWYKPTVFGKVSVIATMLLLIAFCMSNYSRTIRRWYIIFYCVYVFLCPSPRHEPTNEINWTEFTTLVLRWFEQIPTTIPVTALPMDPNGGILPPPKFHDVLLLKPWTRFLRYRPHNNVRATGLQMR